MAVPGCRGEAFAIAVAGDHQQFGVELDRRLYDLAFDVAPSADLLDRHVARSAPNPRCVLRTSCSVTAAAP